MKPILNRLACVPPFTVYGVVLYLSFPDLPSLPVRESGRERLGPPFTGEETWRSGLAKVMPHRGTCRGDFSSSHGLARRSLGCGVRQPWAPILDSSLSGCGSREGHCNFLNLDFLIQEWEYHSPPQRAVMRIKCDNAGFPPHQECLTNVLKLREAGG